MTPATTDPSTDTLLSLYHSGAYACLAILVLFLGLRWGSKNVSWLAKLDSPGRPHYVAAGLGALALIVPSAVQGQIPSLGMLLAAASTAYALILPGAPVKIGSAPSSSSQAGFVAMQLQVVIACVLFSFAIGCAWWSAEKKALPTNVVDCTKSEVASLVTQFAPAADQLLLELTGNDGKVDQAAMSAAWSGLKGDLRCVAADAVARALVPAPADPAAPKASPLVADHASLIAAHQALFPGVHFHTAAGDL
jgi:hypothetical protein